MFTLEKKLSNGTRVGYLNTPHGCVHTPFFMPVGTVGSVKAMMPAELRAMGAEIILSNTYHLYLRPGEKNIKKLGGLHKFMNWDGPILTDSGGYQVFSLGKVNYHDSSLLPSSRGGRVGCETKEQLNNVAVLTTPNPSSERRGESLVKITEDGVEFQSHLDGSKHFFTPEKVIDIQLDLGVDILMPLDVCPSGKASRQEVEEAVRLTTEWAKRAKIHFDRRVASTEYPTSLFELRGAGRVPSNRPLLHGIVQGGLYEDLRRKSTAELIALDFDGYSVGGLAVDFETRDMWKIVKLMGEILPEDKQRYLMGVGTPDDIIKATRLGMDMFDCVLPTRLARHGSVYVRKTDDEVLNRKTEDKGLKTKAENTQLVISSEAERRREILYQKISPPSDNYRRSRNDKDNQFELINLFKSEYRLDEKPIDENCGCEACRGNFPKISPKLNAKADRGGFSRAYISHLLRCNEILGMRLTTMHNLWQYLNLMITIRAGE